MQKEVHLGESARRERVAHADRHRVFQEGERLANRREKGVHRELGRAVGRREVLLDRGRHDRRLYNKRHDRAHENDPNHAEAQQRGKGLLVLATRLALRSHGLIGARTRLALAATAAHHHEYEWDTEEHPWYPRHRAALVNRLGHATARSLSTQWRLKDTDRSTSSVEECALCHERAVALMIVERVPMRVVRVESARRAHRFPLLVLGVAFVHLTS